MKWPEAIERGIRYLCEAAIYVALFWFLRGCVMSK